jgi:predicted AlkP superfamily pyrophosphatase or phosphodiesterase
MRKFLLVAAAVLAGCGSQPAAQAQFTPTAQVPKLTIVISVDQFSADLFEAYRPMFTGGMARLARGTVFRNGYQAHAATETCPGHSTILTGDMPTHTGIVANAWYDGSVARADKVIYCAEDESRPGSSSTAYTPSVLHLKVPTLGDLLKTASPQSRVVAVAGKDRSALMMGGRKLDQRWFWNRTSKFESDLPALPPKSVTALNAAVGAMLAAPDAGLEPTPACIARSKAYPLEGSGRVVGNGRFQRAAGDAAAFRASPALDGATLALAAGLIGEMQLGKGPAPDLIAIGLSATDLIGHGKGNGGQEMCLQMLSLDRDLGGFFRQLDNAGIDYAVVLTADHGGMDIPERARFNGVADAARMDMKLNSTEVGNRLAAELKLPKVDVLGSFAGDIFIGTNLAGSDRARAIAAAKSLFAAHPQVEAVFTKAEAAKLPLPTGAPDKWTLADRVRASFDPERSGDLIVINKRNTMPVADTTSYAIGHGSPWDYDRRVPVIFWRPGMNPADRPEAVSTTDIMPTLAALLGVRLGTTRIDGHCLAQVPGISCPR